MNEQSSTPHGTMYYRWMAAGWFALLALGFGLVCVSLYTASVWWSIRATHGAEAVSELPMLWVRSAAFVLVGIGLPWGVVAFLLDGPVADPNVPLSDGHAIGRGLLTAMVGSTAGALLSYALLYALVAGQGTMGDLFLAGMARLVVASIVLATALLLAPAALLGWYLNHRKPHGAVAP